MELLLGHRLTMAPAATEPRIRGEVSQVALRGPSWESHACGR
jgi:hypothetical protein